MSNRTDRWIDWHAVLLVAMCLSVAAGGARAQARGEWRGPQHIYSAACVYCHSTGVGPVLMGRNLERDYVFSRVRQGFGPMPAFKPSELSDADLEALWQWLWDSPAKQP